MASSRLKYKNVHREKEREKDEKNVRPLFLSFSFKLLLLQKKSLQKFLNSI